MKIIIIIIFGIIILFLISILLSDFYFTMKYAKGWVSQGRSGTAIKEFIKEEDGCVYFVDVWDTKVKTCGDYEIKLYKGDITL